MRFNPKAQADESQMQNRSGGGGGGGFSGGLPGIPGGGGVHLGLGGTLVVVVLGLIFGVNPSSLLGGSDSPGSTQTTAQQCTGAAANKDLDCGIDLITTSVQNYWKSAYPDQTGNAYKTIQTVKFTGTTPSGCGTASTEMGPFYCPNDQRVYIDKSFMTQMLEGQLGAKGGPFALGYVVAHEYGHHIEDQLGILGQMKTQQGPKSDSVKAELMADCLGGMWAKNASSTVDQNGVPILEDITADDISRAIDAATAVGDDRIQKESGGGVHTESWTHGSSAQRVHWFNVGLKEGSLTACNTFATGAL
jgi:predicted metalloprotease